MRDDAAADRVAASSSNRAPGRWDKLREELFGRVSHLHALGGLLDERWIVGDLGCGTGQVAAALAPFVARVIAVDRSGEMLQAARARLRDWPNVDVRRGELEALPIDDGSLDAATLMLVLHHAPDPAAVLAEAARALKPVGACSSPTCCRTIARSTGSRWAMYGWAFPRIRCGACVGRRVRASRIVRARSGRRRQRARRCSWPRRRDSVDERRDSRQLKPIQTKRER